MIILKNVNKYFFRHKKNEIHVINNTSLEFGDNGLVALLGPSGSGKTTLLNAIGGLDKVNSGRIFINGQKMPRIGSHKKDKIRVLNIGYIFQNFNLLDNLTVYDNVALSLKMIGIKNKREIKKRVDYILESVGMYRYRNKPAGMLSGGQRQRIGIARAIVKNPDIIIADEPTGNLDSKNTIEIMNIIKSISKDKLVILVTHEKELAEFYATRIISLEDGCIKDDKENLHENELDYRIDNKIYLKDFKNKEVIGSENGTINLYSDNKESLKLDIVIKNGNIYIKTLNKNRIEVVDDESGIEFINDNYKKISKNDYEKSTFDLTKLDNKNHKLKYASIYNIFSMLKAGFKKVANYTLIKKILLLGFFASSMFIVYAISNIFGVTNIRDKAFVSYNREYIRIQNTKNTLEDFEKLEKIENVHYVLPGNSKIDLDIKNEELVQLVNARFTLNSSMMTKDILENKDIVVGKIPENEHEIAIDKFSIDESLKKDPYLRMLDLNKYENYIGKKALIGNLEFTIVGIVDTNNPSIYLSESIFYDAINNSVSRNDVNTSSGIELSPSIENYERYQNNLEIKEGHKPEKDYEVIVNIDNKYSMPLNKEIDIKVGDTKLKVVGYYYSKSGEDKYYVSKETYKKNVILTHSNVMVYSTNKDETMQTLRNEGFNAQDTYEYSREKYIQDVKDNIVQSLIISGILLAISFIEIFLMIRASFLSRVKEVGIYRAIGVKKTDIYKMFMGEILIITTIAGMPGAILMIMMLKEITKVSFFTSMYVMDVRVICISIIIIYILNLVVGLLPIRSTIKKTPSEILSRNDVD